MVLYFVNGRFFGCGLGDRVGERGGFWWTALEREQPLSEEERRAFSLDTVRATLFASGDPWDETVGRLLDATVAYIPPLNLFDVATLPTRAGREDRRLRPSERR